jgi:predicted acetyltransferase
VLAAVPAEIRTIRSDELAEYVRAMRHGFHVPPPDRPGTIDAEAEFRRGYFDLDRTWGAFDGDRCVATLHTYPFQLTVPGGATMSADGLTNVTVSATHRRQGLLRGMLDLSLRAAAERGDPVSILIASEYGIYGRFGYAVATEQATYTIDTTTARFGTTRAGTVAPVEPAELRALAPPVYERFRLDRPGSLNLEDIFWDIKLGLAHAEGEPPRWKGLCVVHRDQAGEVDGYLRYRLEEKWDERLPRYTLRVDELVSVTAGAYADLWRFCCEVDWVRTVVAEDRRMDEPLPWLLDDARAARLTNRADFLWLRLLDAPAALRARRYGQAGRIVLEVVDPGGYAAGRFALDAGPDGADCAPTREPADLTLPQSTLAAAHLGGFRLRTLAEAGLVDEHRPGALHTADRMLAGDEVPWCTVWF